MLHMFFLSRYYNCLSIIQINPSKPSPSSATEIQSFRFSVNIFIRSILADGPKMFFTGLEHVVGGPVSSIVS